MTVQRFPELGFYSLPGHALSPKDIFEEVRSGDDLGFGSTWVGERPNTKDIGVMGGIAAAESPNMGIATGLISNLPLRHPLAIAGFASTMASVTDGRFALGIGRGIDKLADMTGTTRLTFKLLEDYITILRQLWRGEAVTYDGPAGKLGGIPLGIELETPPPVIMGPMGYKGCYWAGQHCDGVLLTSLMTKNAVTELSSAVRKGAEDAGRDPQSVRIWTIQVTACDVSEEDVLNYVVRRMNTYVLFPSMMKVMCKANGWDLAVAEKIRRTLAEIDGSDTSGAMSDEHTSRELDDLRRMRELYPDEWLYEGNAVGSAQDCAKHTREMFDAGVDSVLFHGSPPQKLASLLKVWPKHRPVEKVQGLSVNPGYMKS